MTNVEGYSIAGRVGAVVTPSLEPSGRTRADERTFTIGELSREFGVTLRALRFYESKGLITPHRRGTTRFYSAADRDSIARILAGKRLGFTLAEIRRMVAEGRGRAGQDLHLTMEKCLEQIVLLEEQKRGIEVALVELKTIQAKLAQEA